MLTPDYARVEKAIRYLDANYRSQPELRAIADEVGLSEFHFQRLFRRWAGISPKRFLQHLTAGRALDLLRESRSALDASYEVGLSGSGRLHDLLVNVYGATPGEIKADGAGLDIAFGFFSSPFGECLLATTERGICHLSFAAPETREAALNELCAGWRRATVREDPARIQPLAEQIFSGKHGDPAPTLLLKGTNFQLRVWEALLRIPEGCVVSYGELAERIGAPRAARAVGTAVGRNPIAYLIPCHRVIRSTGAFGGYRWGVERKKMMLGWEAAHLTAAVPE